MTFCIPSKPLSRRLLLRGLGAGAMVSVGLPRLAAMLNGNGNAYAQGLPLGKRFGVWFWGNGIVPNTWVPAAAGVGDEWALSPLLMNFESIKEHLTVLTGYEVKHDGEVHHIGPAGALTGHPHDGQANYTAATIEHVVAGLIGKDSAFESLQVGVSRATANGQGHTVNYASSSGPNAPVMPEYNATTLFDRLFGESGGGAAPGTPNRSFASRRRVLDAVMEDAQSLRMKLGADDARRLDQHLEGIGDLEARIALLEGGGGAACSATAVDATKFPAELEDLNGLVSQEQNEAMADLITYALACDLTKAFLFQHGRPAAHYDMGVIGINVDIHDNVSHIEGGDQPDMSRAMMYWFDQCRVLMEKLKNTPDGDGNLLDNSLIYGTSDISFGRTHSKDEYPALLFGKAGGAIKGNQHLRMPGDNISKILFEIVNLYGADVTEFGADAGLVTSGIPEIRV